MFDSVESNHSTVAGGVNGEWVQEMTAIFALAGVLIREFSVLGCVQG
tara:strand:- start:203 stop:343 length:141 start_codon:yes stop_codon:yes gene_type:complete